MMWVLPPQLGRQNHPPRSAVTPASKYLARAALSWPRDRIARTGDSVPSVVMCSLGDPVAEQRNFVRSHEWRTARRHARPSGWRARDFLHDQARARITGDHDRVV